MRTVKAKKMLCPSCMEEHDVKTISVSEKMTFKSISVTYKAEYLYCERTNESFSDEKMMSLNDSSMKDAYRKSVGLLTSEQIKDIRKKYEISQADLCVLLGWGAKTVTRYEGHQVQDRAHDTILKKIDQDPEWFITLLEASRNDITKAAYEKSLKAARQRYSEDLDSYLDKAVRSQRFTGKNKSPSALEQLIYHLKVRYNSVI